MKFKIIPITGDASFRKFYRVIFKKKSKIIVICKKEKYKNLVAYAAINKFLNQNKILAPKLYSFDYKNGIMEIEDFGDISFYKVLLKTKNRFLIYKEIVDLLIKVQRINPKKKIKVFKNVSYKIGRYTKKNLFKESDLFFDWYLPQFLSKKKVSKIKKNANKVLYKLYNRLNFSNSNFVHRDFHVQNLIKVGKKVGVIDSQDALIGSPAYDLVSLIDDVRIKNSKKLKQKIFNYYLKKAPQIYRINPKIFLQDFNILSVQRSLKIIGIFSRLSARDKKSQYLKLIPYTWSILKMRMESKIFLELKAIFKKNILNRSKYSFVKK